MVRKYIKYGIKIVIVDIVNITVLILIVTVIVIAIDFRRIQQSKNHSLL